jgi:hypothetical protein
MSKCWLKEHHLHCLGGRIFLFQEISTLFANWSEYENLLFYSPVNCRTCSSSCWFLPMSSVSIVRKGWKSHVSMWLFNWSRGPFHGHLISADGQGTSATGHALLVWSLKLPRCSPVSPHKLHLTVRRSSILRTVRLACARLFMDASCWLHTGHRTFPVFIHPVMHFWQNIWSHGVHTGSLKAVLQMLQISSGSMSASLTYS